MKSIYILFVLSVSVCTAQISELSRQSVPSYDSQVGIVIKEIPIEGSQYFNEMYTVGNTFVNGRNVRLLMRFNAYSDQIEMKDKYQKAFNLLKRKDLEAHFGGKTYKMLEYVEDGQKKQGYFNPLNQGYVVLYHKPSKVFVQAENPENGYDKFDPPTFKDDSRYYLKIGSQALVEISLNKRQLLKYLKKESGELKQYIGDHNIKLKTEQEVVDLLNYFNKHKASNNSEKVNS